MAYFLVYVSTATQLMSTTQLRELLSTCRRRNTAAGISGALLYKGGTFMQVLEGEQTVIEEVFSRMHTDPRHHDIDLIVDGDDPVRQFSGWSMAFRDLSVEADELTVGFSDFMNSRASTYGPDPTLAQRILLNFRGTLTPVS